MDKRFNHQDLPDTAVYSLWPFEHTHPHDVDGLAQVLAAVTEYLTSPTAPTGLGTILGRRFGVDDSIGEELGRSIADEWSLAVWAYTDSGRALRLPRLNLAGWCNWCSTRWCTSRRCIELHAASQWQVCPSCGGRTMDEADVECLACADGLVEVTPVKSRYQ
ncbi:MAG: hypothetical protein AAF962_22590 [Actinomycetota bacterium]